MQLLGLAECNLGNTGVNCENEHQILKEVNQTQWYKVRGKGLGQEASRYNNFYFKSNQESPTHVPHETQSQTSVILVCEVEIVE